MIDPGQLPSSHSTELRVSSQKAGIAVRPRVKIVSINQQLIAKDAMKQDRFVRDMSSGSLVRSRRQLIQGAGAFFAAGVSSMLLPRVANAADLSLGVVSFPGPSISSHSKVIIKNNDFDKKRGWNLRWEIRPTSDAFYNDFVTGVYESIDFGGLNVFANLFNKGVPLKLVQATVQWPVPVVVRTDSGINSIAELKGKRIAVGRASFAYAYVNATLRKAGIDLEKDTTFTSVDFFQALPRLQRGDFDAAVLLFEHAIKLLQDAPRDFKILFDANREFASAIGIPRCYQYQAIRTDWLEKNKGGVDNVVASYRDAAEFFSTRATDAVRLLALPTEKGGANLAEAVGMVEYVSGTASGLKTVHLSKPVGEFRKDIALELEAYRQAGLIDKVPSDAIFL